ncbi:hypothetical protein K491DRAFT_714428 [Lophiostoma macrostomum CBS 122681]|uniref:Uncharacterized protein n=1 Tax=Lophiostoma macrostomum CBS 122681 TaxID=1314788 RepID=A0A6A6TDJ4_9PLEO|nr:hypothetical protein K491DRAFT_714428 [Lophiostoma macrostomum CBS 122681]
MHTTFLTITLASSSLVTGRGGPLYTSTIGSDLDSTERAISSAVGPPFSPTWSHPRLSTFITIRTPAPLPAKSAEQEQYDKRDATVVLPDGHRHELVTRPMALFRGPWHMPQVNRPVIVHPTATPLLRQSAEEERHETRGATVVLSDGQRHELVTRDNRPVIVNPTPTPDAQPSKRALLANALADFAEAKAQALVHPTSQPSPSSQRTRVGNNIADFFDARLKGLGRPAEDPAKFELTSEQLLDDSYWRWPALDWRKPEELEEVDGRKAKSATGWNA